MLRKKYAEIVLPEAAQWHAYWLDTRGDDYQPQVRARITHGRKLRSCLF